MENDVSGPQGEPELEEAPPQAGPGGSQPGRRRSRPGGGWPLTIMLCLNTLVIGLIARLPDPAGDRRARSGCWGCRR